MLYRLDCRAVIALLACFAAASLADGEDAISGLPPAANLNETSDVLGDVEVWHNQPFCPDIGRAGLCDVYSPTSEAPTQGYPVIVVIHGGGWMSGDKWTLEGYSRLLAKNGFVAIAINYRLAPKYKFPSQVDDVREALLWTKANAERLSLDLSRLGVFGYSAGGHLSALVASLADEPIEVRARASHWDESDTRWTQLPRIQAVCAGGPPCDFREHPVDNQSFSFFLGGSRRENPEAYISASPTSHVSPEDPVTQIIHGDTDFIVPIEGSRLLHQLQLAAGVDSRLEVMPKQGHMITFVNPKTSEKVLAFFREVLSVPK